MFDRLTSHGLIAQHSPGLLEHQGPLRVFAGFDPTAPSLHAGHLSIIQALSLLREGGAEVCALIGGFTAGIGDPTGRSTARVQQSSDTIAHNATRIRAQIHHLVPGIRTVDNREWLDHVPLSTFLSHTANRVSVHPLLQRTALERSGLTLMEMCYPVLQGMDFAHLAAQDTTPLLQIGGTDQWGNICSGFDLCRPEDQVFGMTIPLLTDAQGRKMGKSQGGATWLDSSMLAPEAFWNTWRTMDDTQIVPTAQRFGVDIDPTSDPNTQKIAIAHHMTDWVHGAGSGAIAAQAQANARNGIIDGNAATLPRGTGDLLDLCVAAGFAPSRSQARTAVLSGAIRVDGTPTQAWDTAPRAFTLSLGKRRHVQIR